MKARAKKQIREIASLVAFPDDKINTSDIRELRDWSGAVVGKFYRPIKEPVTIRLDADVLAWLKSQGRGYQTRINYLLRRAMLLTNLRHWRRKTRR
ncbi:MAG: BrnA antitoxin family protein [Acidobacteria bacterium]|nr:BrnA antitoxin family protein [Acidobacteriota bacterium]MBI3663935.1 BrnA antitoxin family protein [Acidobacteriota bacterium]